MAGSTPPNTGPCRGSLLENTMKNSTRVFAIKGPGGLSPNCLASTRRRAEMIRKSAITVHAGEDKALRQELEAQLTVVECRLIEI